MTHELKHGTVGTDLTQAEWEGVGTHVLDSQATGDMIYASSSSQLRRLAKGTDTHVMILASGLPAWSSSTGITSVGTLTDLTVSGTSTTIGTVTSGVWQGTDVGVAYGGTGVSTLTANGVLIGNGASAITSVAMSTKGHILIGDGSGNPQMLGVGTNTHVLTADSGETTGTKWAAPAAAAAGSLTGSTLASGVTASSLTSVGTIATGVWQGTTVAVNQGGTGATSLSNLIALSTMTTGNYVATVTGGTGITSSGATSGEGIAHSLSVDASQTQITAVGTIATGVWQGTDVGVAYGGTGVSTLTDGGVLLGSGGSAITAMAVLTDGQMIVGNGSTDPVAESGATLRTSIGLGTGDSPTFTSLLNIGVSGNDWIANGLNVQGTVTGGERYITLVNSATSGASTARIFIRTEGGSSGDPYIDFYIGTANKRWTVGADNSEDDRFAISHSSQLGTDDVLRITDALDVEIVDGDLSFGVASTISAAGNLTLRASAGNDVILGDDANLIYIDGGAASGGTIQFDADGASADSVGNRFVHIKGAFTAGTSSVMGLAVSPTLTPAGTNSPAVGISLQPVFTGVGSQTHTAFLGLEVEPAATMGSATVTTTAAIKVMALTEGVTNYALWVDTGTSRFDGNIDLNSTGFILNVGASGNDWSANTLTLSSDYSGTQEINCTNSGNTSAKHARVNIGVGGTSAGDPYLNIGDGTNAWKIGGDTSETRFAMSHNDALGSADFFRCDTSRVTTLDNNHGSNFDYVCGACGRHEAEGFECCGIVEWHDDVMDYRALALNQPGAMDYLTKVGVYEVDGPDSDSPGWIGIRVQPAIQFGWSMAVQNRERMDAQHEVIDERLARIEQALGV